MHKTHPDTRNNKDSTRDEAKKKSGTETPGSEALKLEKETEWNHENFRSKFPKRHNTVKDLPKLEIVLKKNNKPEVAKGSRLEGTQQADSNLKEVPANEEFEEIKDEEPLSKMYLKTVQDSVDPNLDCLETKRTLPKLRFDSPSIKPPSTSLANNFRSGDLQQNSSSGLKVTSSAHNPYETQSRKEGVFDLQGNTGVQPVAREYSLNANNIKSPLRDDSKSPEEIKSLILQNYQRTQTISSQNKPQAIMESADSSPVKSKSRGLQKHESKGDQTFQKYPRLITARIGDRDASPDLFPGDNTKKSMFGRSLAGSASNKGFNNFLEVQDKSSLVSASKKSPSLPEEAEEPVSPPLATLESQSVDRGYSNRRKTADFKIKAHEIKDHSGDNRMLPSNEISRPHLQFGSEVFNEDVHPHNAIPRLSRKCTFDKEGMIHQSPKDPPGAAPTSAFYPIQYNPPAPGPSLKRIATKPIIYGDPSNPVMRMAVSGGSLQGHKDQLEDQVAEPSIELKSGSMESEQEGELEGMQESFYPKKVSYLRFLGDSHLKARVDTSNGNLLAIYQGDLQSELPHGQGTLKYSEGEQYQGQWIAGLAHGKGTLKSKDYDYEGCFKDGLFDGVGTLKLKELGVYEGSFADGRFSGKGKFTWNNKKKVYIGDWKGGLMHGKGVLLFSDGRKFLGGFVKGMKQGRGHFFFSGGRSIEGQWFKGKLIVTNPNS